MRPTRDEIRDRLRQALALRSEGLTLKEIGRRIGYQNDPTKPLSGERARQLIWTAVRKVIDAADESDPLWLAAKKLRDNYVPRPFEPKPRSPFSCSECHGNGIVKASDGYNSWQTICPTCGGSRYWDIKVTHIEV
jgi:hypothetical protein